MGEQVALYLDFENVAISAEDAYGRCDVNRFMEVADRYGRVVIKRAYGDWSRFSRYRQELIEYAVDLVQLFRYGVHNRKNSADIVMAVDVIEAALTRPNLEVFVLVTGDSDFSAVARRLRSYGKHVVGVGLRDATSELLVRSCDEFIIYDDLLAGEVTATPYDLEMARKLLLRALEEIGDQAPGGRLPISQLLETMRRISPGFDVSQLGFRSFRNFVAAQDDLVNLFPGEDEERVALRSTLTARSEIDKTLQYRTALDSEGLRLVGRDVRQEVLRDFFTLLHGAPGRYSLEEAILELKAQYDVDNRLRFREEIQDVAQLMKQASLFEPPPQSWEMDPLTLRDDLDMQTFVQQCESAYLRVYLQRNMAIDEEVLAGLLYQNVDEKGAVRRLAERAQLTMTDGPGAQELLNGHALPQHLAEIPELRIALLDMVNTPLEDVPSLEEAARLNAEGLQIRTVDFERARGYFLKAAKMMHELIKARQPGASLMDLEWYLASYCSATAGALFSTHNYARAIRYYKAFFALVKETEPVWDRVRKLAPPMLSFYFTIASNEHNDMLRVSPGRTHPARLAVVLHNHENPAIRRRWLELVRDLVRINPTLLRGIIHRLAFLEEEDQLPGAHETRQTLVRLIRNEPVPDDPLTPVQEEPSCAA